MNNKSDIAGNIFPLERPEIPLSEALEKYKKEFDTYIEFQTLRAKIAYAFYNQLLAEGFNKERAK